MPYEHKFRQIREWDMRPVAAVRKNPDVVFRRIGEECVLVPIVNNVGDLSSIYTLNETGTRLWELLDSTGDLDELCKAIEAEYEVSADTAAADVSEFLRELTSIKFLEEA